MSPAHRYAAFFATLEVADLRRLEDVLSPEVRFVDPFNDVRGVAAVRAVFEHMFAVADEARFEVLEVLEGEAVSYLRWRLHLRLRGERPGTAPIEGVSRVVFDPDGRVQEHVDYWDAAAGLYGRFPVIGGLMGWLRRRIAKAARCHR
ncbi:nuclear transport factor 2 family protein [Arhodomonas sp. SL1]|uniref:nuclear transport factor 2 family protein n=1 Tax=Arhodomonas sp. SL1 TaxID=3425691 RepID=UPI003F88223B